jgi:beta-glucanase (GH16 family)
MFYYASEVHETDIEILTNNEGQMYYTNQPSVKSNGDIINGATTIVTPDNFSWEDWHEHRIDWTPGSSKWYVDGEYMANTTFEVPKVPMGVIINMWSDGSSGWTGDMPTGGVSYLDLQWVSASFNTSGPRTSDNQRSVVSNNKKRAAEAAAAPAATVTATGSSSSCTYVCKIDDTSKIGYPEQGSPSYPKNDNVPMGHGIQLSAGSRNIDNSLNQFVMSGLDAIGTVFGAMSRMGRS